MFNFVSKKEVSKIKTEFLFFWLVAYSLGGGLGFEVAHVLINEQANGFFFMFSATLIFYSSLAYAKHRVFRRYKKIYFIAIYQGIDFFAWIVASLVVVLLYSVGENDINNFSSILLSLLSWSGIVTVFLNIAGWYGYYKDKLRKEIFIHKLIRIIVVMFLVIASIFLFIDPLESFHVLFTQYNPTIGRFLYVQASLLWVGLLTGLAYVLLPYRNVYDKWNRLQEDSEYFDIETTPSAWDYDS